MDNRFIFTSQENEDPNDRTPKKRGSTDSLFEEQTSDAPENTNNNTTPKKQRHSLLRQSFNEAYSNHTENQFVINNQFGMDNRISSADNTTSTKVTGSSDSTIIFNSPTTSTPQEFRISRRRRNGIDFTHSREELSSWRPSETPMELEKTVRPGSDNLISTPYVFTPTLTTPYNIDFTSYLTPNNETSNQRRSSIGSPRHHEFEDLNYNSEGVTIPPHNNAESPESSPSHSKQSSANASRRPSVVLSGFPGQVPDIQINADPNASLYTQDDRSQMARRLSIQNDLTTSMTVVATKLEQHQNTMKTESSMDALGVPAPQTRRRSSATVEDIAEQTKSFGSNPLKTEPLLEPEEKVKQQTPKIMEPKPLKDFEAAMVSRGFRPLEHFPVTPQIRQHLVINRSVGEPGIIPDPINFPDREPVEDLFMDANKFKESSCKGFRNHLYEKDGKIYTCSTVKVNTLPDALDEAIKKANTMTFKPLKDGVIVFVLALTFGEDKSWELNHRTAGHCLFGHPGLMTSDENYTKPVKKVTTLTTSKQEETNSSQNENNNAATPNASNDPERVEHKFKHLIAAGEEYYLESAGGIILINDKTGRCSSYLRELGLDPEPILESCLGPLYAPSVTANGSVYYRLKNVPSEFERHLDLVKALIDRGMPYDYLSPDLKSDIKLHHLDETYQRKVEANKEKNDRYHAEKRLSAERQRLLQNSTTGSSSPLTETTTVVHSMNLSEHLVEQHTGADSVTTSIMKSTPSSELITQIDTLGLNSEASSAYHRNHLHAHSSDTNRDRSNLTSNDTLRQNKP